MISQFDSGLLLELEDQYGDTCVIKDAMVANDGKDLVFAYCSSTKFETAWAPIQHAKVQGAQLHAVVTTDKILFHWYGERVE
jgi:hypothetical protein